MRYHRESQHHGFGAFLLVLLFVLTTTAAAQQGQGPGGPPDQQGPGNTAPRGVAQGQPFQPGGTGQPGDVTPGGQGTPTQGGPGDPGGVGQPNTPGGTTGGGGNGGGSPGGPSFGSGGRSFPGGAPGSTPLPTPGSKRRGRTTGPLGGAAPVDSWLNWWELNRDHYLDVERRYRQRSAQADQNSDLFLGEGTGDPARPVTAGSKTIREKVIPALLELVEHKSVHVRREAALAIGRVGSEKDFPRLIRLSKDKQSEVRQAAILAMGMLKSKRALPLLTHILKDPATRNEERAFAAIALGILGDTRATDDLIDAASVTSRPEVIRAASIYALGFMGTSRSRIFLEYFALRTKNTDSLRAVATQGLAQDGGHGALDVLLKLTRDEDVNVRRSAVIGLGQIAFASPYRKELDDLREEIEDWSGDATRSGRALNEIENYIRHLEVKVEGDERTIAAYKLDAVNALVKRVEDDSDVMVRNFALIALGEIGDDDARKALGGVFTSARNHSTRAFAALALGIAPAGPDAAKVMHRRLRKSRMDNQNKGAVVLALGLMDYAEAGASVAHHMKRRADSVLTSQAAIALGLMNQDEYVKYMRRVLLSKSRPELKPSFGVALALLGDHEAAEGLGKMLTGRTSVNTKVQAAAALAAIRDTRTLDVLVDAAKKPRQKAVALAAITRAMGVVGERGDRPILSPYFRSLNYLNRVGPMNHIALL